MKWSSQLKNKRVNDGIYKRTLVFYIFFLNEPYNNINKHLVYLSMEVKFLLYFFFFIKIWPPICKLYF